MASFGANEIEDGRLDWEILRDGGIALYWRPEVLADDLAWLKSHGYRLVSFEAAEWKSEEQMHQSLKTQLLFPEYYGNNLDALNECICDDLGVPDSAGLAIVLNHYDQFLEASRNPGNHEESSAETVLSIFANAARYHMLLGRRLLILVQSDDPRVQFRRLGLVAASWNRQEWLSKNRGC